MFYFILLVLGGFMIAMGIRANVLNQEVRKLTETAAYSETQTVIWHELGGFNTLLLEFGPNMFLSFLAGVGALAAYLGLWMCALGNISGLLMVILGAAVCGLMQVPMITGSKSYFKEYETKTGEDPRPYFTGKNGLPNAVYTSVMIGIGKTVKFVLLVSVVGILLYVILRQGALRVIDLETAAITGDYQFPPKTIYDEYGNPWFCTDAMGEDGYIKVYSPAASGKADRGTRIYVDSRKLQEKAPNATGVIVTHAVFGNKTFHWE